MAAAVQLFGRGGLFKSLRAAPVGALGAAYISPSWVKPPTPKCLSTSPALGASSAARHWQLERVAAVGLLGAVPAGFFFPGVAVDYTLAVLIPLHGHWGYESVIEDYVPESLKNISKVLMYGITGATFAGLMYLNWNDVGICKAVKMIWAL